MIFLLYFGEALNFEIRFYNECAVPVHTGGYNKAVATLF